jgi:hypothetical protein
VHIDYSELQDEFSAPVAGPRNPFHSAPKALSAAAVSVLDMDRTRNVGVLMRTLKLDAIGISASLELMLLEGSGREVAHGRWLEDNEIAGIHAMVPSDSEASALHGITYAAVLLISGRLQVHKRFRFLGATCGKPQQSQQARNTGPSRLCEVPQTPELVLCTHVTKPLSPEQRRLTSPCCSCACLQCGHAPCPHTASVCRRNRKPNKEEAFLLQLLSMPLLKQRLVAVRALRSLATALATVSLDIDILGNACADVHATLTSGTLKSVLLVTLTAGNFLNSGTSKAKARAFQVQDLLKLKTVKGRDGCPSLLHYVAKHMLQAV